MGGDEEEGGMREKNRKRKHARIVLGEKLGQKWPVRGRSQK
jgi:hypothetical protein